MPHFLIVEARFYPDLADALLQGARETLYNAQATHEVVSVPGALEIVPAIRYAIETDKYDGFVALGCIIRGETTHYDIVASESARGISWLGIEHQAAIGNGILTVENEIQAWERAGPKKLNKGGGAAEAAMALVKIRDMFEARA